MASFLTSRGAFLRFPKDCIDVLRRLDSPKKIQDYLDSELEYNEEPSGDTCLSVLEVLKQGRAHCIEGAMLAAAARLYHGKPALLLDLRASSKDDDHVIMPFKEAGKWGAVAQSHFMGLGFREPIYSSTAELARSYFELYYLMSGKKTLREYSVPLDVRTLKPDWLYSSKNVYYVGRVLDKVRHYDVLSGLLPARKLRPADSRLLAAEKLLRAQSKR